MELACGGNCTAPVPDPTDADMIGFGVLAAFIFPVIASHFFVILSYITSGPKPDGETHSESGIHPDQYSQLDKTVLPCIRPRRSRWELLYKLQYQQIILPLSDQLLITTLGLMVALYSQICTMSHFTFEAGLDLAWVSAGVHMDCLMALGKHFHEHKTQANIRTCAMILLLIFILVTEFLDYIMWENDWAQVASCALHFPAPVNTRLNRAAWLSMCYWVGGGYYDSIVQLRNATELFTPTYTAVIRLARWFYRSPQRKKMFEKLEGDERARVCSKYKSLRETLEQRYRVWWKKWWIAFPVLLDDVTQSVCWAIFTNVSFTAYNMTNLIKTLKVNDVDTSPLKEPKFGQIMPLIMPLIIVLGVLEATSNRDKKRERNGHDRELQLRNMPTSSEHGTASRPDSASQQQDSHRLPARARTMPGFESLLRRKTIGRLPHLRGRASLDEGHEPLIVNTLETTAEDQDPHILILRDQESGKEKEEESRMLLAETVYEQVPLFSCIFILVAVAGQIGFIVSLLYYYRQTIIVFFIINFSFNFAQTSIALRWLRQATMKRSGDSEQGTAESTS